MSSFEELSFVPTSFFFVSPFPKPPFLFLKPLPLTPGPSSPGDRFLLSEQTDRPRRWWSSRAVGVPFARRHWLHWRTQERSSGVGGGRGGRKSWGLVGVGRKRLYLPLKKRFFLSSRKIGRNEILILFFPLVQRTRWKGQTRCKRDVEKDLRSLEMKPLGNGMVTRRFMETQPFALAPVLSQAIPSPSSQATAQRWLKTLTKVNWPPSVEDPPLCPRLGFFRKRRKIILMKSA